MDYKPSIVIVSSSSIKPKSLIKFITRNSDILEEEPHKLTQNWTIDTKYYTAEVDIHGITEHYQRTDDFNESVKALIVHMDTNKETGLYDLSKWEAIENECEPEVKILVSNYCTDKTKITIGQATEWCLKRGYEFVELYPSAKSDQEDEIIKEKLGVDRIIEALQTLVWPNLEMKDEDDKEMSRNPKKSNAAEGEQSSADVLNDLMYEDVDTLDDFTELFGRLHTMKQNIQSMPETQRKQCAEQMVKAFWRAIGGDDEELGDL